MKTHIVWSFGGFTLLLVAVLLLVAPNWAGAQTAVIPAFVVKDFNGNVVGPIVGWDGQRKSPIVAYDGDLAIGRRTLLTFKSAKGFEPEQGQLFFENIDCEGQAYLMPPDTSSGLPALTGIAYGVGPDDLVGIGGDIWLYRSDFAGPGANIEQNSNYQSALSDFTNAAKCVNQTFSLDLVPATKAVNVTVNFPQPYTASVP